MIVRMSLSFCVIENMLTKYLFYFDLLNHLQKLHEYFITKHANIKFANEKKLTGHHNFQMF